jgi:uncharacterized membrane protein AbrB (regulator of aidB expression)
MAMNEYIKLIIENLNISYTVSVMLIGYIFTKSKLISKLKIQKRWLILAIGLLVAVFYYFVINIDLDILFFSFVTAQFLNLYVSEYLIDYLIKRIGSLTKKTN